MKKLVIILSLFCASIVYSQGERPVPMVGVDSIPAYILEEAEITPFDAEYHKAYDEAKFYSVRVYNYAMIASAILNDCQDTLAMLTKKRDKNKYLKSVNKYLKDEFGEEIENMSINRGRYLMKIIHKETGLTAFEIIKMYNGGLSATWWQGVVKVFGANLKHEYEPLGEDKALSKVLTEIENGKLKARERKPITKVAKDSLSKKAKKKLAKQKKKEVKKKKKH